MVLIDQFDILPSCPGEGRPISLDHSKGIDDPILHLLTKSTKCHNICNCTSGNKGQLQQLELGSADEDHDNNPREITQHPCDIIVAGSFMDSNYQSELVKCRNTTDYKANYYIQLHPEPTNIADKNALAVQLKSKVASQSDWTTVGYIPKKCIPKVSAAINKAEIIAINIKSLKW